MQGLFFFIILITEDLYEATLGNDKSRQYPGSALVRTNSLLTPRDLCRLASRELELIQSLPPSHSPSPSKLGEAAIGKRLNTTRSASRGRT